jgi:hypothetical protein
MLSSSVTTILNTTNNRTKTQQWIFGMIIGSAPFLLIIICWIFASIFMNTIVKFYQYMKKRHRHGQRKNVYEKTTQINAV